MGGFGEELGGTGRGWRALETNKGQGNVSGAGAVVDVGLVRHGAERGAVDAGGVSSSGGGGCIAAAEAELAVRALAVVGLGPAEAGAGATLVVRALGTGMCETALGDAGSHRARLAASKIPLAAGTCESQSAEHWRRCVLSYVILPHADPTESWRQSTGGGGRGQG